MSDITAVILAGGYGTRLKHITKNVPKPMIEIAGRPVIDHILDNLKESGITRVIIKVHYMPEVIMKHVGNKVMYYYEKDLLTHPETVEVMRPWIQGRFFVINGDTLSTVDCGEMLREHKSGTVLVAMEEWRSVGIWLYDAQKTDVVIPYRQKGLLWFDVGTPERLAAAKNYYERYEKN